MGNHFQTEQITRFPSFHLVAGEVVGLGAPGVPAVPVQPADDLRGPGSVPARRGDVGTEGDSSRRRWFFHVELAMHVFFCPHVQEKNGRFRDVGG